MNSQKSSKSVLTKIILIAIPILLVGLFLRHQYELNYDSYMELVAENGLSHNTMYAEITVDVTCERNSKLGNELSYEFFCDNEPFESGDAIKINRRVKLRTEITEHDKIPDVSKKTIKLELPPYHGRIGTPMFVRERGGRSNKYGNGRFQVDYHYRCMIENYAISPFDIIFWNETKLKNPPLKKSVLRELT